MSQYRKLNPERKAEWIAALLSGDYEQGRSALRNGRSEYCCLGVACDLAVKADIIPEPTPGFIDPDFPSSYDWAYLGLTAFPPLPVYKWLNLDNEAAFELAGMNDRGYPFETIAAWIGANL